MTRISEEFGSYWLKAEDLAEDEIVLTIDHVGIEEFKEDKGVKKKVSLRFREKFGGKDKGMVLNVTNRNTMVKLYGDDTDDWEGKRITLYASEVAFDGKMTPCIRVKSKVPKAKAKAPEPAGAAEEDDLTAGLDDCPY